MKGLKLAGVLCFVAMFLMLAADLFAASARARCRVRDGRVRIQVDGQDLPAGTYIARVTNLRTGAADKTDTGKEAIIPSGIDDVDLDFDSTADPDDKDSHISRNFARVGDRIRAIVIELGSGDDVAMASTVCVNN
jgi:hypothetical protein